MSVAYRAVNWTRHKRNYDLTLVLGAIGLLGSYSITTLWLRPDVTAETVAIRAFGLTAFFMLHVVLVIGPLTRIDRRLLPLLYNRRHLGVMLGLFALTHGTLAIFQFHALGEVNPLVSVLTSDGSWADPGRIPFQPLGLAALVILGLMAATSHDFWLATLKPPVWKALHMLVYLAWLLLLGHVGLGALQGERHPLLALTVVAGAWMVVGLHVAAAVLERRRDRARSPVEHPVVDVGAAEEIPEGGAITATVGAERVAVFRHQGKLYAVSNVCPHQNGPLGEGRIVDGCITCPWHGYQFDPATGKSPPPFEDQIATYHLTVESGRVMVSVGSSEDGPRGVELSDESGVAQGGQGDFFVGYLDSIPPATAAATRRAAGVFIGLGMTVALAAAVLQAPFAPAVFEFGTVGTFEGTVAAIPYPTLLVNRPGAAASGTNVAGYTLVATGKHGADPMVAGALGRPVRLEGKLIYRGTDVMIELAGDPQVTPDGAVLETPPVEDLGMITLAGEIVDAKCWLGVMNPASWTVHRACAVRCISGGVPPALMVRRRGEPSFMVLLAGENGEALSREILDRVAVPVRVTGRLVAYGSNLVLWASPRQIERIAK